MTLAMKPVSNPLIVFREEFDDWAVLFDPDSGEAFGLNPVSAFIWKHLDGRHTVTDILKALHHSCDDIPEDAGDHIEAFVADLIHYGFAGCEYRPGI